MLIGDIYDALGRCVKRLQTNFILNLNLTLYTELGLCSKCVGQRSQVDVVRAVSRFHRPIAHSGGHGQVRAAGGRRGATRLRRLLAVDGDRRQLSGPRPLSVVAVDRRRVGSALGAAAAGGALVSAGGVDVLDVERAGQRHFAGRRREAPVATERSATAAKQATETALELFLQAVSSQTIIYTTINFTKCR